MPRANRYALVIALTTLISAAIEEPPTMAAEPIVVTAIDYAFEPSEITVPIGESSFSLINTGVRRHNLIVFRHSDGVELPSATIRSGEQADWSLSFDRPGRYQFWCNEYSHLERGMSGYITVE